MSEQHLSLPIAKEFWKDHTHIILDGNAHDHNEFMKRAHNGYVDRFHFRLTNRLLKSSFFQQSFGRLFFEHSGWHLDGGLHVNEVRIISNYGTHITSPESKLNALLRYHPEYAALLAGKGWPISDDIVEKKERNVEFENESNRHWMVRGHNDVNESLFCIYGEEIRARQIREVMMDARQDLTNWDVHYKVWRNDPQEQWKLWESIPQHEHHVDWRRAKRFKEATT